MSEFAQYCIYRLLSYSDMLVIFVRNFANAEEGFKSTIDILETDLQQQKTERETVDRVCWSVHVLPTHTHTTV